VSSTPRPATSVAPGASASAPTAPAASATGAPGGSGSVTSGSGSPGPTGTPWPKDAALALTALGSGDAEIAKAVADFSEAVANEDLVRMRGAAIGLKNLVDSLIPKIPAIEAYPPMHDLAAGYRAALTPMSAGAADLIKALDAGDANGILAATQVITQGFTAYGNLRQQISDWVGQLPDQQHYLEQ
jgi:hypothetical protein